VVLAVSIALGTYLHHESNEAARVEYVYQACIAHHALDACTTLRPAMPTSTTFRVCLERFLPTECAAEGLKP
jgi:hypothetical protein